MLNIDELTACLSFTSVPKPPVDGEFDAFLAYLDPEKHPELGELLP